MIRNFQDYFHVIYNRTFTGPKSDGSQKKPHNISNRPFAGPGHMSLHGTG